MVSHRGEQMSLVALDVDGATHRFAVHREQHRPDQVSTAAAAAVGVGVGVGVDRFGGLRRFCPFPSLPSFPQPGADRGIDRRGVDFGEHAPDRCLRRWPGNRGHSTTAGVDRYEEIGGCVRDPSRDRGERAHTRHDRTRAQRQHHRDRMVHPPHPTRLPDLREVAQQIHDRNRRGDIT
jgi:hypothetical protein